MAKPNVPTSSMSLPTLGMIVMAIAGAIVVAASFEIIKFWPLPAAVAPYFGGNIGAIWGLVVGGLIGWIVGFLTDEKHFE